MRETNNATPTRNGKMIFILDLLTIVDPLVSFPIVVVVAVFVQTQLLAPRRYYN